jgi:hypothetical protein
LAGSLGSAEEMSLFLLDQEVPGRIMIHSLATITILFVADSRRQCRKIGAPPLYNPSKEDANMKPEPIGWMTEGGRIEYDKPIQWRVFVGTKEHLIWKVGPGYTVSGGRDGRPEYESLDDAVASLRPKAS